MMVKKPLVTPKQAEMIDKLKDTYTFGEIMQVYFDKEDRWVGDVAVLNDMHEKDYVIAFLYGYEVRGPKFTVGDYVKGGKNVYEGSVLQVTKVEDDEREVMYWLKRLDGDTAIVKLEERYLMKADEEDIAAEKEKLWWKEHDRSPWELRNGDVLRKEKGTGVRIVEDVDEKGVWFYGFIAPFPISVIKSSYRVVCFAEDRLDFGFKVESSNYWVWT